MDTQEAIELLENLGYVVIHPEANLFLSQGETWENKPKVYKAAFMGNQDAFSKMLDDVDVAAMVATWSDSTLRSVEEFGSDLAFNGAQMQRVNQACRDELAMRYPIRRPTTNGMGDDGRQQ